MIMANPVLLGGFFFVLGCVWPWTVLFSFFWRLFFCFEGGWVVFFNGFGKGTL